MRFLLTVDWPRWVGLLLCAGLLAGCSPEYDWRRVQPADAGFAMMLPAKPDQMSRRIQLDGLAIDMTLHGARVNEVAYTVGVLQLPDDNPATRERVLAALRQSMMANIGGTEQRAVPVMVRVEDPSGQRGIPVPAQEVEIHGRMRDQPAVMSARFLAQGRQAWQVMVLAPSAAQARAAHAESVTQFLDGFVLIAR